MKIKSSKYNILIEILCLLFLAGNTLYLILNWSNIPAEIPGHYNAAGEIDRWGKKSELLFVPIINWMQYVGISVLERFPQIWNTGVDVTEENRERIYRIIKNGISTVKLVVTGCFTFISFQQAAASAMPGWFLLISMGLMFGSIIYYCIKLTKNK